MSPNLSYSREKYNSMNVQYVPPYNGAAIFDVTRTYRYSLKRWWSGDYPQISFIMLNPNRADELHNDPTISRCINFAYDWGFGSLEVVNLFAYCTSDPLELRRVSDPIGKDNDHFLVQAVANAYYTVIAWGTQGTLLGQNRHVLDLLAQTEHVYCFGLTKEGHPRYPLYLKKHTSLQKFVTTPI